MKSTKKLLGLLSLAFAATHLNAQYGVLDNTFGTSGVVTSTVRTVRAVAPTSNGGYEAAYNNMWAVEAMYSYSVGATPWYQYDYVPLETTPNVGGYSYASGAGAPFYTYAASDITVRPDGQVITLVNRKQYRSSQFFPYLEEVYGQGRYYIHSSSGVSVSSNSFAPQNSTENLAAHSIYALPDNKIWAIASLKDVQNNQELHVHALINADLTLNAFGAVQGQLIPTEMKSNGILRQPDGKMLFMLQNNNFGIMRRQPTGARDSTFGVNGVASMPTTGSATSMALQADGKIVQLATTIGDSLTLHRLTSMGVADNTFGTGGVLKIRPVNLAAGVLEPGSIEAQADGKLLISLFFRDATTATNNKVYLIRLNAIGTFDNTFGTNGVLDLPVNATSLSGTHNLADIDIASDGKIYVVVAFYTNPHGRRQVAFSPAPQGDKILGFDSRIYRVLSGLVLTAVDFVQTTAQPEAMIYPNPVAETFTLSYELSQNSDLNLSLMDMQGRTLHTFPAQTAQPAGKYSQQYNLPQGLTAGNYILRVQTQQGQAAVQITIP